MAINTYIDETERPANSLGNSYRNGAQKLHISREADRMKNCAHKIMHASGKFEAFSPLAHLRVDALLRAHHHFT